MSKLQYSKFLGLLLLILILPGACTNEQDPVTGGRFLQASPDGGAVNLTGESSCSLVLSALPETRAEQQQISKLQQAVLHDQHVVEYLDRLGWAFIGKARSTFDPGFYKLAELTADCIDSKEQHRLETLLLRGHVMHAMHNFSGAEKAARALVAQRGHWLDYGLLGDVLMEQGQLDGAIDAYQHMMDLRPGPQVYVRVAHIRWLRGDLPGAIDIMHQAVRAISARDPETAAWVQSRLATYLFQSNKLPAANLAIDRALALQADYPPALLAKGRFLLSAGKNSEAVDLLLKAASKNPLPEYQWALIEAFQMAGIQQSGSTTKTELMQRGAFEDRRTFALYLATINEDIDKAVALISEELLDRQDVFTMDVAAWVYHAAGQTQEAQKFSEFALAEGTRDARLFFHAGAISASNGAHQKAELLLRQASEQQHMLLPSERRQLAAELKLLQSQFPALADTQSL